MTPSGWDDPSDTARSAGRGLERSPSLRVVTGETRAAMLGVPTRTVRPEDPTQRRRTTS